MTTSSLTIKDFLANECGATAIEYGLIAGIIVIGLLAGLTNVADANDATFQLVEDEIAV